MTVVLRTRHDLDLNAYERVAWQGERIEIDADALARMAEARQAFLSFLEASPERVVYGVTTGFGECAAATLSDEERSALARQPPLTGTSFGGALPDRVVRGIVVARLANFVDGHAAVRPELATAVAAMLDGELPTVPRRGNGGSGEILALGHLFHDLGTRLALEPKEGLALVNGAPCAAALVAERALDARQRLRIVEHVFALAAEALAVPLDAYAEELEELWGDEHESAALRSVRTLLEGGTDERRAYQPPVSFRILPRVLGRARRAIADAERAADVSLRAVTDNPVFVPPDRVLSNGGYHNAVAAPAMDGLAFAAADLCQLAERQSEALLRELLERDACPRPVTTLSMVQAAWAEDARAIAQPTLLPLGGLGQNDTPSTAFAAWDKCERTTGCLRAALATLAVVASQALHEAGRVEPPALERLLGDVRSYVPLVVEPRALGGELADLAAVLS
jgi:histidine ammonia-lyase